MTNLTRWEPLPLCLKRITVHEQLRGYCILAQGHEGDCSPDVAHWQPYVTRFERKRIRLQKEMAEFGGAALSDDGAHDDRQ